MLKIFLILIALFVCGCVSQPKELTQEESNLHIYYEEPEIDYESLGRVDATKRTNHPVDMLEGILSRAAKLGADAVLIHSIHNKGGVLDRDDAFGTGGSSRAGVYQIQATAIRYVN